MQLHIIPKIINKYYSEKVRIWRFLPAAKISLLGLKNIYNKNVFRLELIRILGAIDVNEVATAEDRSIIIAAANAAINHNFSFLGCDFSMPNIDWNKDPKCSYRWPILFYYYQRSATVNGADIKMPWELSRCHHLLWLGAAFQFTKDDKYALEVISQIKDWIEKNPFMKTVNWACTMDVAIRAVNWMFSLWLALDSKAITDDDMCLLSKSLFQHAFFIRHNLEITLPSNNNHYVSDLVGLIYIGALFDKTEKGRAWYRCGKKRFFREIKKQTLITGINYEYSISYHRLMVELCSYPLYVIMRKGETIPNDIFATIHNMHQYVANYMNYGIAPVVADNDDGRFLPFVKRKPREHEYLITPSSFENRVLSSGMNCIVENIETVLTTAFYPDAGIAILRRGDAYLYVTNCGYSKNQSVTSKRIGTHTHNDNLSFILALAKDEIIVDPGAYTYTSDIKKRNSYRTGRKHNICMVDGEELNILSELSAFSIVPNVTNRSLVIKGDNVNGSYITKTGCLYHNRNIHINESSLAIRDTLRKKGNNHTVESFLHFAPDTTVAIKDTHVELLTNNNIVTISIQCASPYKLILVDDTVSPSYGVEYPSKTLQVLTTMNESLDICFTIEWKR